MIYAEVTFVGGEYASDAKGLIFMDKVKFIINKSEGGSAVNFGSKQDFSIKETKQEILKKCHMLHFEYYENPNEKNKGVI